jgi:hypothetical protein
MNKILIIWAIALLSCKQTPPFSDIKVNEIKVLDSNFKMIRTINDTSEINELKRLILIPGDLNYSDNPYLYKYKLDVISNQNYGGRWIYDDTSGSMVLLSHIKQPKYRVADVKKFNKILFQ